MLRFLKRPTAIFLVAAALFFGWQWVKGLREPSSVPPTSTSSTGGARSVSPFNALVVQQEAGGDNKRISYCTGTCKEEKPPGSIEGQAFSSGSAWFYYTEAKNTKGDTIIQLVTTPIGSKETKVIARETQLTKPRGIFMSPTGDKVAYFLDNIDEPTKKLSEVWVYDSGSGAVAVIAENLFIPDMMTRLRWNASGTQLWFVADSGEEGTPKIEFIVLSAESKQVRASFSYLDWNNLRDQADRGVIDVNTTGTRLAYAKQTSPGADKLVVTLEKGQQIAASMKGVIPYLEWLPDDNLMYAVQDTTGIGFWKTNGERATLVASQPGVLRSAHRDGSGQYVVFVAEVSGEDANLFVLDTQSGVIAEQESIPSFGDHVFLVQVQPRIGEKNTAVAGITTQLTDEELAGFIDKYVADITQDPGAQKTKLVITKEPNVVLLDFIDKDGKLRRLVLTIHDAIFPEWSIRARYEDVQGSWRKIQGGAGPDPAPAKLYEWEEGVGQWILKSSF